MLVLEVSPGDVDLGVLTEVQQAAAQGLLASAMSGYLLWLAPRMAELKESLPERLRELRAEATGAGAHARTPDAVASLALGLETFLEFARSRGDHGRPSSKSCGSGAVRRSRRRRKRAGGASVGEEPTQQFLELLASAIVAGEAHVADRKTGGEPKSAERWGWRPRDFGTDEYGPAALQPRGKCVGWLGEDGSLLLEPGAAFAAAQRMARDQGTGLPIAKRTLWKRMAEKDLLASRDAARGRNTSAPPSPGAQDRAPPRAGALSP
jgi:hypothetical protein